MAGMVGNKRTLDNFAPMDSIPNRVSLTSYSGEPSDFLEMPLQEILNDIGSGALKVTIGRVFQLDDIAKAHECMEENAAEGKIVLMVPFGQ